MTLDEALDHWHRERERLYAVDAWIDAKKPAAPPSLSPLLAEYQRLKAPDAKRALKDMREERAKDSFIRMFSAFEQDFRVAFCGWLAKKCGSSAAVGVVADALPESIRTLLGIAAVLEPNFSPSRSGYAANVMDCRNKLAHRGFAATMAYDLEELHRALSEIVALFKT
jgi:hypothetical protein